MNSVARDKDIVLLAADHAGFPLKEKIKKYLQKKEIPFVDFGCWAEKSCDYPDFARPALTKIAIQQYDRGIFFCGSGVGMSIVANKFPGVRAALVFNEELARLSREHNDANVLCLPSRFLSPVRVKKIVNIWLSTSFLGGRHLRRLQKITSIERTNFKSRR